MNQQLTALGEELEGDRQTLQRELDEIELLLKQTATEVERNESRRVQAEERLAQLERGPDRAARKRKGLDGMDPNALQATKTFIFDVRPMVLDDLGMVPTLRRSAAERSRRFSVPVRFESVGTDGRLSTEAESGLFR